MLHPPWVGMLGFGGVQDSPCEQVGWDETTRTDPRSLPILELCPFLRVHELEEMVKDQETMAEQALEEEARRHREAYSKLEREKSTELELLNSRCPELSAGFPLCSQGS